MFYPITYRSMFEFYSVKHIKPKVCFSILHLVKTYQFSTLQSLFMLLLLNRCIQQTFNEMSTLQSDFLFVAIHICNSSIINNKCNSQLSVLVPQRQRITCKFLSGFSSNSGLDVILTFLFFPIYYLECMSLKLPAYKKILFKKQQRFPEINRQKRTKCESERFAFSEAAVYR